MKKFELTSETKKVFGRTFFRIKALISFGVITKGEIGGWLEKEESLSQEGNAWVSGNAWKESPLQIQGTRHFVTMSAYGYLNIGCHKKTFGEWEEQGERIGAQENYTPEQKIEYRLYLKLAIEIDKTMTKIL